MLFSQITDSDQITASDEVIPFLYSFPRNFQFRVVFRTEWIGIMTLARSFRGKGIIQLLKPNPVAPMIFPTVTKSKQLGQPLWLPAKALNLYIVLLSLLVPLEDGLDVLWNTISFVHERLQGTPGLICAGATAPCRQPWDLALPAAETAQADSRRCTGKSNSFCQMIQSPGSFSTKRLHKSGKQNVSNTLHFDGAFSLLLD